MIKIVNLQVDYETTLRAVDNITVTVPKGAIYGLIGNNGAGKTTTMRAIMGLTESTRGEIYLDGIDAINDRERALAKTGFMPDFGIDANDMKIWEFLDLFAACYGIADSERPELITYYLRLLNLHDKRNDFVKGLSRGMTQRLMMAKTLIADPDILILDEPAAGLDPSSRMLLKKILLQKKEEGKTILISSHVLPDLQDICDHVGIMEKGKMVVSGNIDEIMESPEQEIRYEIEVKENLEKAKMIIDASGKVKNTNATIDTISFSFIDSTDDHVIGALITELISNEVIVQSFGKVKMDLEYLMSLTDEKYDGGKENA